MCEALGQGRQSIILRKGGIAEGRDGFSFKHREFFLFPTWFHEQPQKVREESRDGLFSPSNTEHRTPNTERRIQESILFPDNGMIGIRYAAAIDQCRTITSWPVAEALAPLHILRPDVVRERFEYDHTPGIHVAVVRVFRLEPSWTFPNERRYGGCRSWVELPDLPNGIRMEAVLNDEEHGERRKEFLALVDECLL